MARLTISLLGPLLVMLGEDEVTEFGYDKVRALLAYLAIETERAQRREALAALLWPEQPDHAARNNLRRALLTLRAAIDDQIAHPPFLLTTRDTIQFNRASDYALDVTSFAALLAAADAHAHPSGGLCAECVAQLEQAVALYRGDFLAQFALRDSVAFSEWALIIRERLHRHALSALARLLAHHERQGSDEMAQTYARRLLALEPWDEAVHCCLMRLFARQGRRNAALAQYARCRQVLADELGIEPSPETTALYEQIRTDPQAWAVGAPAAERASHRADLASSAAPARLNGTSPADPTVITANRTNTAPSERLTSSPRPPPALLNGHKLEGIAPADQVFAPDRVAPEREAEMAPIISTAHPPARYDRNRSRMLAKVKSFWIAGILEQSLHGAALIELGLAYQPEAVERPWQLVVQQPNQPQRTIPPGTLIVQIYDELDAELLILGAPGSGKTMTLLQLARDLIARAEQNSELPIPVVFNLSSWAAQRRPLTEWLVDELSARYQVPRRIGRAWVEAEQVLPLLDGLDEVAQEHRTTCVKAINQFREEHWLLDIVVCSRSADYEALTARLRLQGAVVVQPLTDAQVEAYLSQTGDQLAAVRGLLHEDAALRELADTPLMLSIMALAYQGLPIDVLRTHQSLDDRRRHLFDTYVQRMFVRRGANARYSPPQTLRWLMWLARAMVRRSQTIFFIEGLQPDWLAEQVQRWHYSGGVGLIVGLAIGLVNGSTNALANVFLFGFPDALIFGALNCLIGSVVSGVVFGKASARPSTPSVTRERLWRSVWHALQVGILVGLVIGLGFGMAVGLVTGLGGGLIGGFLSGLTNGFTVGFMTQPHTVQVVETLRWSWSKAWTGVVKHWRLIGGLGVSIGLTYTLFGALQSSFAVRLASGLASGLASLVIATLILGLISGLTADEIDQRMAPNQGIGQSARHAVRIGGIVALDVGLIVGLVWWFTVERRVLQLGPAYPLALAFEYGLWLGLLVALVYGGLACIQHLVLRVLLWRSGVMPWNYARFLDYAAERLFLRKIGGGYIFAHRLLLEHFAALEMLEQIAATPPDAPGGA